MRVGSLKARPCASGRYPGRARDRTARHPSCPGSLPECTRPWEAPHPEPRCGVSPLRRRASARGRPRPRRPARRPARRPRSAPVRPRVQAKASQKVLDARLAQARAEAARLADKHPRSHPPAPDRAGDRDPRAGTREDGPRPHRWRRPPSTPPSIASPPSRRNCRAITPEIRDRLVRTYKLLPLGYDRLLLSLDQALGLDRAARIVGVIAHRDRTRLERFLRLRAERQREVAGLQRERSEIEGLPEAASREGGGGVGAASWRSPTGNASLALRERRELNSQLVDELTAARDRLDRSVSDAGSPSTAARPWPSALAAGYGRLHDRAGARAGRGALRPRTVEPVGTMVTAMASTSARNLGAPVQALQAGTVAYADAFTGFGRVVILDHGGSCTRSTAISPRSTSTRDQRSRPGTQSARSEWRLLARPRSISKSGSTVGRSIPHNG